MNHLFALAGLLGVAAITPGPNNLVVLRAAAQAGLRGALPAIAGVVLGGLLLLAVIALGEGSLFAAYPSFQRWIGMAGALYLSWLGAALFFRAIAKGSEDSTLGHGLPISAFGLIGFQFLNPKSWVMVLTALATWPATGLQAHLPLAGLFVLIPSFCLLLWAAFGAWLARRLARPVVRRSVDAVMGTLLVTCAAFLIPLN
ncbi:LysE family transporter [Rhodanobacter fulvus Jip2]|uniref:LysE family transporter n=1 Tax=Rhodanobacter fulvus Jip2 TaxID=1163408 RepID=I4VZS3_9GAMM|nr:LysE family translocator [Rhodanobacter fulvus]EIL92714.1 LysE family transporter [Rhodanobacter fulvus Jip2]